MRNSLSEIEQVLDDFSPLALTFFYRDDVVQIARELIGKYFFSHINGVLTSGKIVETEAYNGRTDKASHAYKKLTPRTEVMYGLGGHVYVYLIYGIHQMFNIVTNESGLADAVLIRALEPLHGKEHMVQRRGGDKGFKLTSGPGALGQAMGMHTSFTGRPLTLDQGIWIAEEKERGIAPEIISDRRVGVDYAEEDASLPWRFFAANNEWISKKKQKDVTD